MNDMEMLDELFHYIQEIPEDNCLEMSEFVLLPSVAVETSQQVTDNDNNVQSAHRYSEYRYKLQENCTKGSTSSSKGKDTEETPSQNYPGMTTAKRGRPPGKPPTRAVVRRRRKVGCSLTICQF